jgi:hypothetical protein
MTDIAVMRNPVLQTIRNFAARIALGLPELDIAYPDSPLSVAAPHAPWIIRPDGYVGLVAAAAVAAARGSTSFGDAFRVPGDLPRPGERWPTFTVDGNPIGAGDRPHFAVLGNSAASLPRCYRRVTPTRKTESRPLARDVEDHMILDSIDHVQVAMPAGEEARVFSAQLRTNATTMRVSTEP